MNVESYIFQSPSPQRVQVGRPDASVQKEETNTEAAKESTQETTRVPQEVQDIQVENPENIAVKSLNTNQILDLYV
ncbi:hypothetical protein N9X61_01660 [Sulfurimonas sp.]|nr:hypothetical protein [Sulfurimonas sp.]